MSAQPWFKDWFNSPYYHRLYANRDEKEAAGFIDGLLEYLQPGPGSRMVDVACGRGRHSVYLNAKGFDVTGIDLSPDSISFAKNFENDHLHFYQHDMRQPFWTRYFGYAFNFFTSFGYFNSWREHQNAIRTMTRCLVPGGWLVIDYLNTPYWEDHFVPKMEREQDGILFHVHKRMDQGHFYKKIVIEDGKVLHPIVFREQVAKFSLEDFEKMLSLQQMQIREVFGDYQLGSYQPKESPRMVIIAENMANK